MHSKKPDILAKVNLMKEELGGGNDGPIVTLKMKLARAHGE